MKQEHAQFYEDVIKELQGNSLAIFAGAGLSKLAGYVDWKGLLRGIANDLGLNIDRETDLISIAQYNFNKVGGRSMLNQKIINEFNEDIELTENHKILTRLPIQTYWTTNYDDLIERALKEAKRIADVKHDLSQLNYSKPRRDAVVYKMHGDHTLPDKAIITKDDYESYSVLNLPFINALSGDLSSKLFIFIGFSFTDPNLDYILARVRLQMRTAQRHHYYFIKRVQRDDFDIVDEEDFIYKKVKQEHFIVDLKRNKLQPVFVDSYPEITAILKDIESIYKKQTIFISGSAHEYGALSLNEAQGFIHKLSGRLIREGYRIVNGFGLGIGSAVINGALEEIYKNPNKYNESLLMIKPFPQFATGNKNLPDLWTDYRREMLKYAGISIYIFGNKLDSNDNTIINAQGVRKEFDIAKEYGIINIPIKGTGYISADLAEESEKEEYFTNKSDDLGKLFTQLSSKTDPNEIIESLISLLKNLKST